MLKLRKLFSITCFALHKIKSSAFSADLKALWGFLTQNVDLKLEIVPTVAYSCFVLHNYCEIKGNGLDDEEV